MAKKTKFKIWHTSEGYVIARRDPNTGEWRQASETSYGPFVTEAKAEEMLRSIRQLQKMRNGM